MSGASALAAARRRRANPQGNPNQRRPLQAAPQTPPQKPTQTEVSSAESKKYAPITNAVDMLKNVYTRVNEIEKRLERDEGNNSFESQQQIENINRKLEIMESKMGMLHDVKENKIDKFEERLIDMEEKLDGLVQLCAKIQTFSMETNTAFLIFKNIYEKEKLELELENEEDAEDDGGEEDAEDDIIQEVGSIDDNEGSMMEVNIDEMDDMEAFSNMDNAEIEIMSSNSQEEDDVSVENEVMHHGDEVSDDGDINDETENLEDEE